VSITSLQTINEKQAGIDVYVSVLYSLQTINDGIIYRRSGGGLTFVENFNMVLERPFLKLPLLAQHENSNNPIPVVGFKSRRLIPHFISGHNPIPTELLLHSDAIGPGTFHLLHLNISGYINTVLQELLHVVDSDKRLKGTGDQDDGDALPNFGALQMHLGLRGGVVAAHVVGKP